MPEPRPTREPSAGPRAWTQPDLGPRVTAIGCLLGIAVTHAFEVQSKLDAALYMGVLFLSLIGGANVLALMLAKNLRTELAWPAAALLAGSAIVGYVWSRAIGLPGIEDHIGHWLDPLGTAAVVFEATLLGLSLPRLRGPTLRFSTATTFLASGLVIGGLMLGQGAGHGHGAGGGHHTGMNVDAATPGQQAEARELATATMATARERFPSFQAARAAGYKFAPRPFEKQKDLDYWHLTHPAYLKDRRKLDPQRPESLMFWKNDGAKPLLMAAVFRVPTKEANPELGGPILQWHLHRNRSGRLGRYKMTHLWFLPRLRDAFSMSLPTKQFQRRWEDLPDAGSGAGA
jgi:hypothetical protein